MNREEIIKSIIEYFKDNEDLFNDCIEELDSYNGCLGDDRIESMDMLAEIYSDYDPIKLLERAFYGWDADCWTTDEHGEKYHGKFNPNRNYFYYNGYGNFVSTDYKDYSDQLDDWAIEAMLKNRNDVFSIENDTTLSELFNQLEECEA